MTKAERFALNQWLSDYPEDMTYDEIIAMLDESKHEWVHESLCVWELVEHHTLDQVAEIIEDTRKAFERITS